MAGGVGTVLDLLTNEPIPNARVTLECLRQRFGHGFDKVRDVVVTTDASGQFQFSRLDVWGCDFGYVHAKKEGYAETASVDIRYGYTDYEHIPSRISLTPVAELNMQALRYEHAMASGRYSSGAHEYLSVYKAFLQSKLIAETPREKAFVTEKYCSRLIALYASLSREDKEGMQPYTIEYGWKGMRHRGRVDHEKEVALWCGRSNLE